MKKVFTLILAALLITALLASCSSSGSSYPSIAEEGKGTSNSDAGTSINDSDDSLGSSSENQTPGVSTTVTSTSINNSLAEKIIYSYNAQIETTKFDETIKNVSVLLNKYGAFIETSNVNGNNYGYTTYRTAEYTLRVPVNNYAQLTGSLSTLGNVYSESSNAQNITTQFMDSEARLDTYRTEESRLLAMLERSATVADMITIEQRLSDVRYQIESLTSTLKNWQNQVDYSSVTLRITEVEELTTQVPVQRTYWEQLRDGFNATLKGIGTFFKGLFMGLVVSLPVLFILGVLAVIAIVIIRLVNKKSKQAHHNQNNNPKE